MRKGKRAEKRREQRRAEAEKARKKGEKDAKEREERRGKERGKGKLDQQHEQEQEHEERTSRLRYSNKLSNKIIVEFQRKGQAENKKEKSGDKIRQPKAASLSTTYKRCKCAAPNTPVLHTVVLPIPISAERSLGCCWKSGTHGQLVNYWNPMVSPTVNCPRLELAPVAPPSVPPLPPHRCHMRCHTATLPQAGTALLWSGDYSTSGPEERRNTVL